MPAQEKSRSELEENKKKIEKEIQYTNNLLSQTRQSKESSINELVILKRQINKREELIGAIEDEIGFIDRQLIIINDSISALKKDLKKLKEEYASMIYYAYKNRNIYDRLMFIFSAEDINQAYRRIKYFQQYSAYRKNQARLIAKTSKELDIKILKMEGRRKEKESLIEEQKNEIASLELQRIDQNRIYSSLTRKEKKLKQALQEKEKAASRLQKAIEDIIAEEIRLAEEKAKREANMKKKEDMSLTPTELQLSENFEQNMGKLPWPSDQGVISGTYGQQAHPVLKRVKVNNNGINILTAKGSNARAVFDGVVTRVIAVPNNNNVVIIRHGNYLTVYSNLDEVFVRKDQQVHTLQEIGSIFTSETEGKTELHFELWKSKSIQNPTPWLMQR
ncbi:MAG: peptidoglycan DD-metalloendopeptidase family protein [Bacteroidales bacterium]